MMKKTETNLKQIAYETIKRKIIHCDYMPNDILSEMMLMEEIDASGTPIREALNMLSQEMPCPHHSQERHHGTSPYNERSSHDF